MALYGTQRDISLFRHLNRELMGDIITQQCAFYKFKIEETKVNLYGEAADIYDPTGEYSSKEIFEWILKYVPKFIK